MHTQRVGTIAVLLTLALICGLLLPGRALSETAVTDDQNYQGTYEIRNAEKIGVGTASPGALLDVRGSAIFNEAGADADFRIEGDTNADLFSVDASQDAVGIGTTANIGTMGSFLHVFKSGGNTIGTAPQLLLGSAGGVGYLVQIGFGWTNSAGLSYAPVTIGEICESGSGYTCGSFFVATRSSTSDVAPTERLRVTYDGKVVTRGTGVVINEDGADADMRVEGDTNENLLFVDAGKDKIGIGSDYGVGCAGALVNVYKPGVTTLGTGLAAMFGSAGGAGELAQIGFGYNNNPAQTYAAVVIGEAHRAGASYPYGDFFVATRNADSDTAPTERLRVTAAGNVGIGTTNPGALLDVRGTAVFNEDGADVDFRVEGDTNANLLFIDAGTDRVGIGTGTPSVQLHNNGDFITMGPYVDVRGYASLSAAITAIGASQKTLLIPNTQSVSADLTIPANVHLMFLEGSSLNISTGVTVNINGPLTAPIATIFTWSGTGKVVFGASTPDQYYQKNYVDRVYPQWWGAKADASNDDTAAIQAAINSYQTNTGGTFANGGLYPTGGTVFFPVGTYMTTDTVNLNPCQILAGASCRGSIIRQSTQTQDKPVLKGVDASNIQIQDLTIETAAVVSGNHGIALSKTAITGMKFTMQRLMFANCYDGINLSGETVGSSIVDVYMRNIGHTGICGGYSIGASKFATIYICNAGACGIDITGAGMSTFDNVVTEGTGNDGVKLTGAYGCTFNSLYLGDGDCTVSGNAISLIASANNTFNGMNIGGAYGCDSAIYLDGSYGNVFQNVGATANFNRYLVEWANVAGTPEDLLQPNIVNGILTTWGGKLGVCNDTTYIALRDTAAVSDPYDQNYCEPFRPYQVQGDTITMKTTDAPSAANAAFVGYGAPDAKERWTFFRNFPGTPNYSFMARGSQVMGVLPATESLASSLITGDSCNFSGNTLGSWTAGVGTVTVTSPGYGGAGYCMKLESGAATIGSAILSVSTTASKLYKLTYRFKDDDSTSDSFVSVFNSTGGTTLARGRRLTAQAGDWREDAIYFTAADATSLIYFYNYDYDPATHGLLDEIYLCEVKSAGSLQITGGRLPGSSTVGGGGTVSVYGNDHAGKPGAVEIDGASLSLLNSGVEGMKVSSSGAVFNETGANTDFRVEGDANPDLFSIDAGADKVGIGTTTNIGTMGSLVHIFNSCGTTVGTGFDLLLGSASGLNQVAQIGFGWTNNPALTYAPVAIGEICTSGSGNTMGDFFVATRDSTSDVAPTERMRVTYDGKVVTRGTGVVLNEDGADADFRVEGDTNADLLVVDAGRDKVGIGTSSAIGAVGSLAHIFQSCGTTLGTNTNLLLGSAGGVSQLVQIGFGWTNSAVLSYAPVVIGEVCTSAGGYTMGDFFVATRNATTDSAPTERMRVTSDGNVGIGTATPGSILTVAGPITTATRSVSANTTLTATDSVLFVDTTSGNITVTMPAASSATIGRIYTVYKVAGANSVTIAGSGADTVNGTTSGSTSWMKLTIVGYTSTSWISQP